MFTADPVCVYVEPNPRGKGAARTGYFIGDVFDSVADASKFIDSCNASGTQVPKLGKCRIVPASVVHGTD